jgi:hypothetical protein
VLLLTSLEHLRGHIIELGLDLGEQSLDLAKREVLSRCMQRGKTTGIHKSRELVGTGNILDPSHCGFFPGWSRWWDHCFPWSAPLLNWKTL